MARKRARDDDDTEEDVEIESASSSFRQGSGHVSDTAIPGSQRHTDIQRQKRNRVAMAQQRGGSTVSDDESDGDFERFLNGGEDDDGYEHFTQDREAEDTEVDSRDELRATQYVHKQMNKMRENVESDHGVIEEVRCRNFMCHGNLRIKLGPLINFIIGHNGSGKSAVLTALTMCLGGKATATNRGASLKSLIKEGEESATLAVKIKNRGDGAYKTDLFGQSITVERHFSRSGTSGFKIKNQADKVVTTKKSDLDDMLDYFAFQLDNPINVLTQDMARQFLSNSSPADKYKFFIKGTQLETLDADYKVLEENLDNIEAKTRSRSEDIQMLKQKSDEANKKKKRLDQSRAIQNKINETRWMHAWAQVEQQEVSLANKERNLQLAKQKVDEQLNTAEDKSGAYEGHNQAFESAQRGLSDMQEQLEPLKEEYNEAKEDFDKNAKELMEHKSQERNVKSDLQNARQRKTKLEKEIAAEQARLDAAEGPEHGERLQRLEQLKQNVEEVKDRQKEHRATLPPMEREKENARTAEREAKQPIEEQARVLERAGGLVGQLLRSQGDRYRGYKPGMADLVRAIHNETRWRSRPVGPAGVHVRLLKQEWSSIIEKTFGGVLDSFFVTNSEDQRLLKDLMHRRRDFPKVPIYIGSDEPLDTGNNEPEEGVDTIMRVLAIDNDLVRNQLIINQNIEQTVLISDRRQADDYMNNGQRPRNVKAALAHTNQRGAGVRFEHTRTGASKASPILPWTGPERLQTDHTEQLRRAKEAEQEAKRELGAMKTRLGELKRATEVATQATVRWQKESKAIELEVQRADDAVQAVQDDIEINKPQDGKLQELHNQLKAAQEEIESIGQTYQDGVNAKDVLNEKARGFKARVDAALKELQACEMRIERAQEKKDRLESLRQDALREKNKALNHVEEFKKEVTQAEEAKARQKSVVEEYTSAASGICARVTVEPGVNAQILDDRLDKFMKDLERAEREAGGTREQLTEAWRAAKTDYDNARDQLKESLRVMTVSTA